LILSLCIFGVAQAFEPYPQNDKGDESSDINPARGPVQLSLNEAILLAVRSNPNVQSSKLNLVLQKFNVYIQEWMFYPHYGFQAVVSSGRPGIPGQPITNSHGYNVSPNISVNTPIGTSLVLSAANANTNGRFNPNLSLQVAQPL